MPRGQTGVGPYARPRTDEDRRRQREYYGRAALKKVMAAARRSPDETAGLSAGDIARLQTTPARREETPPTAIGAISVQTVETHTAPFTMRRQSVGATVDDYLDGLRSAGKRVMSIAIDLPPDYWREP